MCLIKCGTDNCRQRCCCKQTPTPVTQLLLLLPLLLISVFTLLSQGHVYRIVIHLQCVNVLPPLRNSTHQSGPSEARVAAAQRPTASFFDLAGAV
jgi:hypothetical protein